MDSPRGSLAELGIAVVTVVEAFELGQLSLQVKQGEELLGTEKELVVDIVELLNDTVTPGFTLGDKDNLHSQIQAEADKQAEAAGIEIGSPKRELIVELEIARDPQSLPGCHEGIHDLDVPLTGEGFKGHGIAKGINEVSPVEALFAFEVARADQVELMDVIGLGKFQSGIRGGAGVVGGFVHQALAFEDAVNGPDRREGLNPHLLELPLDGQGSLLGVLGLEEPVADLRDHLSDGLRCLMRDPLRRTGLAASPLGVARIITLEPLVKPNA